MNPNAPAAVSSTVSVGCSRKDSSVVRGQRGQHRQQRPGVDGQHADRQTRAARVELRARTTSHSVPTMHSAPSSVNSSIGKVSWAPSAGR